MSVATMPGGRSAYRWHDSAWIPSEPATSDTLVADSWLVDDGTVLAFDLHLERFCSSVAIQGGEAATAARAMASLSSFVPGQGRWFPRIDYAGAGLQFLVRPAPPVVAQAVVVTAAADPRQVPSIKGPDLERSLHERAAAEARGANEAIILHDGVVVDGTTSAVLWWRDDTLCTPPASLARVASVTARSTLTVAAALGVELREESATPDSLAGAEVWVASALHGIRPVLQWVDGPVVAQATRAATWQARLKTLRARWC